VSSFRFGRVTLVLVAWMGAATPCLASRWLHVGSNGASTDKIMVDADSIQKVDQLRIADIMTVYPTPRKNPHDLTLDRHVQKTAFNCAEHSFVGIVTTGYLNDKRIGSSSETSDWKTKLVPLPKNALSDRIYAIVCSQSAPDGGTAGNGTAPAKPKLSSGSGIVLDGAGDILTNNHVVNHCKAVVVKAIDSNALPVTVDAVDPKNDLAILKSARGTPVGEPARFRDQSKPGKLGESIGVIGYPLSGFLSTEPKATFGQVNSIAGAYNDYTLLQISAPIQPGNSGGPVLDSSGLVIGIVESQASIAVAAQAGNIPQNVNFAIRGEVAQIFLAARGIKLSTSGHQHPLATEEIAARGQKSTVLVVCAME
jgi:S1-C subfamily serine protease